MSVRKREWGPAQDRRKAWVVDYADGQGKRRHRTFRTQEEANDFAAQTRIDLRKGIHVADGASTTVKEAGKLWLEECAAPAEDEPLEASTIDQYRQHLDLHIVPLIGRVKLSRLTVPAVTKFQADLRRNGRSPAMVRAVTRSLGSLVANAQKDGLVAHNVVRELRQRRPRRGRGQQQRHKGKLKVGVDIPTPQEVRDLLDAATGRFRVLLRVAAMGGLRASELRGLRWIDVDFARGELHVRQRADRYNKIGPPKSASGERTLPLGPLLLNELRAWKLQCPKLEGQLHYVFPSGTGRIDHLRNIVRSGLIPAMLSAGVIKPVLDEHGKPKRDADGKPIVKAKYTGLHALRHFNASWLINRKVDGGCELPPKIVQERLGHASITITMDTYGHLFPRVGDSAELAAAEQRLLGRGAELPTSI